VDKLKQYEDLSEEVKSFSISHFFLRKVFLLSVPASLFLALEVSVIWHTNLPFFLGYAIGCYAALLGAPAITAAVLASPALLFKKKFKPVFAVFFGILWFLYIVSAAISVIFMQRPN
jgi:hypothetical protein